MTSKATPGPWRTLTLEGQSNPVVIDSSWVGCVIAAQIGGMLETGKANAALIAAAPDLREALEACTRWLDKEGPLAAGAQLARAADLTAARAALAKAAGGQ